VSTVVHLFGVMDDGGAEIRLLEELGHRRGRETHVCVALTGRVGSLTRQFEAIGVEVVPRRLSPTWPLWFVRFLRAHRATHVHSHVQLASGYLLAPAWVAGVPRRIAHLHSRHDGRSSTGWRVAYRAVGRLLLRLVATDVIAVSETVRADVFPRAEVVYDRVDGDRFALAPPGPRPDGPRLIVVGRLDVEKNPVQAVEVLAAVRARRPTARLCLVGRDPEPDRSAVLDRAEALHVADAVEVLGSRSDVPELLAGSDLLVSTSRREGLPGAVIEATAAGLPAVVSSIGPCEEVGLHLPGVVTIPLDADPEIWADVLEDVLDQRADRFTPSRVRAAFDVSPFARTDGPSRLDELWS
jgi:glycosyltransferase involved in cell wall biosynthesis